MKTAVTIGLMICGLLAMTMLEGSVAEQCPFGHATGGGRKLQQVQGPTPAPMTAPAPALVQTPALSPLPNSHLTGPDVQGKPPLYFGFYDTTCPSFPAIVKRQVASAIAADSLTPAQLLRLFFHDCFVMGCDASLLLKSTVSNLAEQDHPNNFTVGKYSVIDAIKAELETACPGVVSCADILGAAAAEAVEQAGGPHIDLAYGRRDGLDSFAPAAKTNLPGSTLQVEGLIENFANVGLNLTDVIVLSGGHTIGQARCSTFADRFSPTAPNPFPDTAFGSAVESYCAEGNTVGLDRRMSLDANTTTAFDNGYFQSLVNGRGILTSDDVLFKDPQTKATVTLFANDQKAFFDAFQESFRKMGRINVLTGTEGQIRTQCSIRRPIDLTLNPNANTDFAQSQDQVCVPASCPTPPTCKGTQQ
ncbi:hypothetical protein KC19_1G131100 [Ceratodon purpureus]|uniref:Peroxidase n=1 Tax=Ceratodon purpureus TaxID=3225 RepID=A0A8T0J7L2_CERPU|nr:hypothetical protein KC19_1G131100 [Ceratodon purpureus]